MILSGEELNLERVLLAGIYDNTKILSWLNSSDGAEGINRPESIFKSLLKDEEDDDLLKELADMVDSRRSQIRKD